MFVLFTDFGFEGPYLGQMKAVLLQRAPGVPIVDLLADAPTWNPRASAYLLASYANAFPLGSVFLAVVDPGVGTEQRQPVVVEADGRWFVGPGNGLFSIVTRRARHSRSWSIDWRPSSLSSSFHGRDLFAPIAAAVAQGDLGGCSPGMADTRDEWPDELEEVIYVDHFGNLITGIRAEQIPVQSVISIGGEPLHHATTFGEVPEGAAFWYANSNGLVELAVNQGRADHRFDAHVGDPIRLFQDSSEL